MNSPPSSVVIPSASRFDAVNIRPPVRSAASKIVARRPAFCSLYAAFNPAMPPPTMAMRVSRAPEGAAAGGVSAVDGVPRPQPALTRRPPAASIELRTKRRRLSAISISSSTGGTPGCSRAAIAAARMASRNESNSGLRDTFTSDVDDRS